MLLIAAGKDPLKAYVDTLSYVFGNTYGFSELLVRMIPLLFTALAAALPARIGLINVGGEGQLYMGAWLATAGELALSRSAVVVLLPALTLLGFVGGGVWALIAGVLRAFRLVNETISTLLLNYVAPLIVSYFIFGPWRSPESSSYPQSPAFVEAARLPTFFIRGFMPVWFMRWSASFSIRWPMTRTRFGLEMRAIGGNPEAARRLGIPIVRYHSGGDVRRRRRRRACRDGRSRGDPGPLGRGALARLRLHRLSGLVACRHQCRRHRGDVVSFRRDQLGRRHLQITQGLPYAVINILMAGILFIVLGPRPAGSAAAMNTALVVGVVASSIMSGTSLLYATLGEIVGERAGIVNLGLEGIMLIGAATRLLPRRALTGIRLFRHRRRRVRRSGGPILSLPIWWSAGEPTSSPPASA